MATQQQGLVFLSILHILRLENMGKSLVRAAAGDHVALQGLCRTGPTPHWLWLPFVTSGSTQERRPRVSPRQYSGAGPGGSNVGKLPREHVWES